MRSGSGELASDLTKRDSDSSAWSDSSHCSLSSLTDARQVAFIRKARDVPGRAVSLPEALPYSDTRCGSISPCVSPVTLSWVSSISSLCTILETSHVTLRQLWTHWQYSNPVSELLSMAR